MEEFLGKTFLKVNVVDEDSIKFVREDGHIYVMKHEQDCCESVGNVWNDIPMRRNGILYKTEKPKALIERIINASSNEGDLVADFYAGSFTTAVVCKELNRNFIGCDINPLALEISKQRLA